MNKILITAAIMMMMMCMLSNVAAQIYKTEEVDNDDDDLQHIIGNMFAGGPPGEIAEPSTKGAREGHKTRTFGHTYLNYQFYWKFVCSFTRWIPSDQFLGANMEFDPYSMTLERFGVVGI